MKKPLNDTDIRAVRHSLIYNLQSGGKYGWTPRGDLINGNLSWQYQNPGVFITPEILQSRSCDIPAKPIGYEGVFHGGVDILPPRNEDGSDNRICPVFAISDGECVAKWRGNGGGCAIETDSPIGTIMVLYQHMAASIREGERVSEGECIGNLAAIRGVHLHLEIWSKKPRIEGIPIPDGWIDRYAVLYQKNDTIRTQFTPEFIDMVGYRLPFWGISGMALIDIC